VSSNVGMKIGKNMCVLKCRHGSRQGHWGKKVGENMFVLKSRWCMVVLVGIEAHKNVW